MRSNCFNFVSTSTIKMMYASYNVVVPTCVEGAAKHITQYVMFCHSVGRCAALKSFQVLL